MEVTGGWRKLHDDELDNLSSIIVDQPIAYAGGCTRPTSAKIVEM
jgi:hypothetical protein